LNFVGIIQIKAITEIARRLIRVSDVGSRHLSEFRTPRLDVLALRVVILRLLGNVKAINSTASHSSGGAPIAPVGCSVIVEEMVLEPISAVSPVNTGIES
jgi:hypothetical protein